MKCRVVLLAAIAVALSATMSRAQTAEELYEAGAYRPAVDSFAARLAADPDIPTDWYNLGNSLYRLGDVTAARVAWIRAGRELPRDTRIRRALDLVPAPDATTAQLTAVPVVTPAELLAVSSVLWVLGWVLVAFRRPKRIVVPVLLVAAITAVFAISKRMEYERPVALVRRDNTALRSAPYPSANARRVLGAGTSVELGRAYAGWRMVYRGSDQGWVQAGELVVLNAGPDAGR